MPIVVKRYFPEQVGGRPACTRWRSPSAPHSRRGPAGTAGRGAGGWGSGWVLGGARGGRGARLAGRPADAHRHRRRRTSTRGPRPCRADHAQRRALGLERLLRICSAAGDRIGFLAAAAISPLHVQLSARMHLRAAASDTMMLGRQRIVISDEARSAPNKAELTSPGAGANDDLRGATPAAERGPGRDARPTQSPVGPSRARRKWSPVPGVHHPRHRPPGAHWPCRIYEAAEAAQVTT